MPTYILFKNNIIISNGIKTLHYEPNLSSPDTYKEDFSQKFYVAKRRNNDPYTVYLHTDGHWQRGTYSEQGYTGYFDTIEEAMRVANLTNEDILERKGY